LQGIPAGLPNGWSVSNGTFGRAIELFGVRVVGTPELGQTLTVSPTTTPNGASLTYKWFRGLVEITGETSNQHVITLADIGMQIRVQVAATNEGYWPATQDSAAVVVPSTFNPLTRVQLTGNSSLGSIVTLSSSGKSGISSLKYQSSRDGGLTWSDVPGISYQITFEDLGVNLQFRVTQSAEGYQTQVTNVGSIAVGKSLSLPGYSLGVLDTVNSFESLGGQNSPGSRLAAIKTQWNSRVRVSGFWFSSVSGALSTKATYSISLSDVGATIRYIEVGVAPDGSVTYRISAPLIAKANTFDNASAPQISGALVYGSKVKAELSSSWLLGAKYTYQWFSNGVAIPGEKSRLFTIGLGQVDQDLAVQVCALKTAYETKCLMSQAGSRVQKATNVANAEPKITTATAKVGTVLRGNPGRYIAGSAVAYNWLRDGIEITGATAPTYLVTRNDAGHSISFKITASKQGYFDLVALAAAKSIN